MADPDRKSVGGEGVEHYLTKKRSVVSLDPDVLVRGRSEERGGNRSLQEPRDA